MKKVTTLLAALLIVLAGCNNNDDETATNANTLNGNWKLVKIEGGFSGINQDITPGTVVWDFDSSNTTINVANNAPAGTHSGLTTGTYEYIETAEPGVCDNFIGVVADDYVISFGCPAISSDTLTLSNGFADGETYTFVR